MAEPTELGLILSELKSINSKLDNINNAPNELIDPNGIFLTSINGLTAAMQNFNP